MASDVEMLVSKNGNGGSSKQGKEVIYIKVHLRTCALVLSLNRVSFIKLKTNALKGEIFKSDCPLYITNALHWL